MSDERLWEDDVDWQSRCLAAETERDALRERLAVAVEALEKIGAENIATRKPDETTTAAYGAFYSQREVAREALARIKGAT